MYFLNLALHVLIFLGQLSKLLLDVRVESLNFAQVNLIFIYFIG